MLGFVYYYYYYYYYYYDYYYNFFFIFLFFHALSVLSLSRRFYCARDDTSAVACCP